MTGLKPSSGLSFIVTATLVFLLGGNSVRTSHASTEFIQKHGQFTIESLLPLTNTAGSILEHTVIAAEALIYAVQDVNTRDELLPKVELGYKIIDNKGENLHVIMDHAIRIVSQHRPRSTCRRNDDTCILDTTTNTTQRVSALIGPASSATAVPVASLLGLYNIPIVAYSASSKLLSDTSRFKSFLRTIPSDDYQAQALASFVQYFDWNYVFFIGNDDEYGRQGLAAFKNAIRVRKICTADDINIAFGQNDTVEHVKEAVEKIHSLKHRVQVVILFMFSEQAAQVINEANKYGLGNTTWIFSDAVKSSILQYVNKDLLHGAFAVDFVSKEIAHFQEYLGNITVKSANGNPWLTKLLEEKLDCSAKGANGKRLCKEDDRLELTSRSLANRWSSIVNMINSVRVIAHGLHGLMNCHNGSGPLEGGACPDKIFPVRGKDLLLYMKNASFTGAMGETVAFDKNGDLTTKAYVIRNYIHSPESDSIEFRKVATWASTSPKLLTFNAQYSWKGGVEPQATCSAVCVPGEMQVGQSDCCWACHPCPKGAISNTTSATYCTQCPPNHYANSERTKCLEIGIDYVEASDPFSIVVVVIGCLGLLFLVAISLRFFQVRGTPLVQDSDATLLASFILATMLAFIFPIFQVTLYRSDGVCRFLSALLLYTVLLVSVTLLAKTETCSDHIKQFISFLTSVKSIEQHSNLFLILAALLFQLVLLGVWYLTDSPTVHIIQQTKALHLRECNSHWPAARFIAYVFPLVILFMATVFAFKERNKRYNHSEAKYISFCTISMCILLIAFFPTYRFVKGITTSVVIATTSIVGAFAVIGCILLPKVFILVFHPERNVPGQQRSNEPTVSSAHTAGSHPGSSSGYHQHDGNGKVSRGPNDGELTSSQSSASSRPGKEANMVSL